MDAPPHPNIARVVAAAERAGIRVKVKRFAEGTRTASDAARAIGCDVSQIVKSLIFIADGQPVVALLSGSDRLDTDKLAAALGAARVRRATGDEARAGTGYAIGGVPPFAHASVLPVLMDERLGRHDALWAAAGLPDAVFEITPIALRQISAARLADLAQDA